MRIINVKHLSVAAFISLTLAASAKTSENFNSRKGIPIQRIKSILQSSCWTFQHFDVNYNGWNPQIEGDGAMVSNTHSIQNDKSGIYTPILNVTDRIEISFDYRFNENFAVGTTRWMNICLVNPNNDIIQILEIIEFNGVNATGTVKYNTAFNNIKAGEYRLALLYGGSGGNATIAVDQLNISAPFKYHGGCNIAPVSVKDRIKGLHNRTATGSIIINDKDNNNESLKVFLVKGSPDGQVMLKDDGSFVFTPALGFRGNQTSFVYRVCDTGGSELCSPNTTVRITFPPYNTQLLDFRGSYKSNGKVELAWNTNVGTSQDKFRVERSLDGLSWESSGIVPAINVSPDGHDYTYIDKLSKQTVHKRDLYYRLKLIKNDGSISTSRLLVVRVYNTRTVNMISVTPNPTKNDIAVNIQLHEDCYVSMNIRNQSGSSVIRKLVEAEKGTNTFIVEGSSKLTPGSYNLEVIVNSKERMLVKLIKD